MKTKRYKYSVELKQTRSCIDYWGYLRKHWNISEAGLSTRSSTVVSIVVKVEVCQSQGMYAAPPEIQGVSGIEKDSLLSKFVSFY